MAEVVNVAPRNRNAGSYSFDSSAIPVADVALFQLTIDLADKLATGKTLAWGFQFSADGGSTWVPTSSATWQSYGPGGLTISDPLTGAFTVNPDPYLQVPITGRSGQILRGTLTLNDAMRLGVIVTVT